MDFAESCKCKPVLLRLSLAGNLEKPLISLYGSEWRERGYGLRTDISRPGIEPVPPWCMEGDHSRKEPFEQLVNG